MIDIEQEASKVVLELTALGSEPQMMTSVVKTALYRAVKSVTKDDICEITGKHIEAASVGERYCPCNNCQAYLHRIIQKLKIDSPR